MLPSNKITLEIESMKLLYLQELDQDNIIQKFSKVIAEHVAKRGTNLRIVGKNHQINKNPPEAMHLTTSNNSYHCDYCHKDGHTEDRCYKKKRDMQNGMSSPASTETALCVYETALILRAKEDGFINDTTFIADTGASSHMVYSKKHLTDIQPTRSELFVGSEQLVHNIQLTGVHHRPCSHCAKAKISMKNIPKEAHQHATVKAERL
jgi:hypothetical protein